MNALFLFALLALAACSDPCAEAIDQALLDGEAAKEGAVRTESGLIYQELKAGYGPQPGPKARVTVHYKGMFADGEVFDSSYERGRPSTLSLKRVIPGWTEGLQMMKGGGKARLVIPPELAYGKKGKPGSIPSCATLIILSKPPALPGDSYSLTFSSKHESLPLVNRPKLTERKTFDGNTAQFTS